MSVEQNLLFAVLAFEDELIDLQQLTAACRAWSNDKSKPLADLLVERGWVTAEHRRFLEDKAERKLSKHQNDPRATLNAETRGDVCDALLKEIDDSDVRQSLSSWPSAAPVLVETLEDTGQSPTRYTWISQVGAGGLGQVWLAKDNNLAREVAVKEIKPGSASEEAVRRLIKEAQITGQLQHPGIVPVYEVNHEGRPFYTMKLVKGETLSKAIREHHDAKQAGNEDPLAERRLLSIFLNVCDAIAYAHSRGVIHRDLKPENIVLGEYGEAIVLDWGLARQVNSDDEDSAPVVVTDEARTDATQAGQKMGTPAYMAPEQASGRVEHMDERTDIYGLGAILFEILSGQAPHRVEKSTDPTVISTRVGGPPLPSPIAAMLHRIATGETPRVQSIVDTIPDELDAVCAMAMAKHRDERYQTAKNLKAALLEFQVHEESIELASRADDDLAAARQSGDYDDFIRARFGFETALEQWPDNARAADGLSETRRDYSQAAFGRGDFDLALSLLDAAEPNQASLVTTIQAAAEERSSRDARVRRLRRFGVAASLTIAVLASVAATWINSERTKALTAQQEEAIQRGIAQKKGQEAQKERQAAVAALRIAERNAYGSDMLLAQRHWEDANISQLLDLLDKHRDRDDLKGFEWGFWDRRVHADLLTLNGDSGGEDGGVVSVAFSPDEQWLASAHLDGTVKLWDTATGQESLTLDGHSAFVCMAFSPDGQRLASACEDGLFKLWNTTTGQESLTLKGHTGEPNWISSVAFSPNGLRLATAGGDQTVKMWDAVTGHELLMLTGHTDSVSSIAFSPDGHRLASASRDETVKVWDAAKGQQLLTLKGHTGGVICVAFSPNGQRLASAGGDGTVKVWDVAKGQESLTLKGHTGGVFSVAFSPNGQRLASASGDRTVKVWDAAKGQQLLTLKGHIQGVRSVAFSPDGLRLAAASGDRTFKVWNAVTDQEALTLKGHIQGVRSIEFSPDGRWLASASHDGTVKMWNTATGLESLTLKGHTGGVFSVAFSPDGQRLVSAGGDQTVKLWDAVTGQELLTLKGHSGEFSWITSVAFGPNGQRLASASEDGTVRVWDVATGQESLKLNGHIDWVTFSSVAFSPNGKWLASASNDTTVRVWDADTGQELLTLSGHTNEVFSAVFSPDGQWLASASHDGTVKVWNAATGQELLTLKGHTGGATCVAFSPDGQRLVSRGSSVKVWDAATGQELLTLDADGVDSLAFSPDGQRLGFSHHDGTVKIWDARSWTPNLRAESQVRGYLSALLSEGEDLNQNGRLEPTEDLNGNGRLDLAMIYTLEELQAYIKSDKTINALVRKQALDWAEPFWINQQYAPE